MSESKAMSESTVRKVIKPWGYELIWAETEHYIGKILHVDSGEALSLQYHEVKDETLYLYRGKVRVEFGVNADQLSVRVLEVGDAIRMHPGTVHRITAIEDSDILESSTAHADDLVRLEDRYGRVPSESTGKSPAGRPMDEA